LSGSLTETVQVIVHHLVSLVIQRAFQSVNSIYFHIDWKELTPELLFKVGPGLDGKNAGICLLAKEVLGLSHSLSILETSEGPKDFLLIAAELLGNQVQIQHTGVKKGLTGVSFTGEVRGRKEFWPCLLFG